MSRNVTDVNLRKPTTRANLAKNDPKRREPFWSILDDRSALGWQRDRGWTLRTYKGDNRYSRMFLGKADDGAEADGRAVLDYAQARAKAEAIIDAPALATTKLTVRKAMDRYVAYKRSNGEPVDDLVRRSEAWILPRLGDKVVSELTPEGLRNWREMVASMPAMVRSKEGEQRYKPEPKTEDEIRARRASTNRVLTMLKAALNLAYDDSLVRDNSAWGRKLKPFKRVDAARIRYLSVAEAQRLINSADPDFRPLIQAALQTGCRYSELLRLEASDFNPDAGTLHIRRPKSGKPRHVQLSDEGTDFFKRHVAGLNSAQAELKMFPGWKASHQARPMAEACERAGIAPIGFHGLRHTYASLCVMNDVPMIIVAQNLGHADGRMVEKHYAHLAPSFTRARIQQGAPRFNAVDKKVAPLR